MSETIKISGYPDGVGLHVSTPTRYAMDLAIDVLEYLDQQTEITVNNTGWKNGFGLEVSTWIPIRTGKLIAELETDGEEFQIRRASGPREEFESLCKIVREYLDEKYT